jgi:hypothetical protein
MYLPLRENCTVLTAPQWSDSVASSLGVRSSSSCRSCRMGAVFQILTVWSEPQVASLPPLGWMSRANSGVPAAGGGATGGVGASAALAAAPPRELGRWRERAGRGAMGRGAAEGLARGPVLRQQQQQHAAHPHGRSTALCRSASRRQLPQSRMARREQCRGGPSSGGRCRWLALTSGRRSIRRGRCALPAGGQGGTQHEQRSNWTIGACGGECASGETLAAAGCFDAANAAGQTPVVGRRSEASEAVVGPRRQG